MKVINARNVNVALPLGVVHLLKNSVERQSRNGPVLVSPTPVCTVYERPRERVLLCPERDANPFFHLYEAMWMLAGRNTLAPLQRMVSRFKDYSDDGKTLWGAYGYRWRQQFEHDQLSWAVNRLKKDPNDRRVVIGMWDPYVDCIAADNGGKDVPCNTQLYVSANEDGKIDMTICCRSNDMLWGAHGANAVHFSVLQEYIANAVGTHVGTMYQISNNYHAYLKTLGPFMNKEPTFGDPYAAGLQTSPLPLFELDHKSFDEDLAMYLDEGVTIGLRSQWLRRVFVPIMKAYDAYKKKDDSERFNTAIDILEQVRNTAPDWQSACAEWIARRNLEANANAG